jgi:hypothetical protein
MMPLSAQFCTSSSAAQLMCTSLHAVLCGDCEQLVSCCVCELVKLTWLWALPGPGAAALRGSGQAHNGCTRWCRAFPTFHIYRGGRVVGQVQGADRGGLRALVDSEARLLAPLEGAPPAPTCSRQPNPPVGESSAAVPAPPRCCTCTVVWFCSVQCMGPDGAPALVWSGTLTAPGFHRCRRPLVLTGGGARKGDVRAEGARGAGGVPGRGADAAGLRAQPCGAPRGPQIPPHQGEAWSCQLHPTSPTHMLQAACFVSPSAKQI